MATTYSGYYRGTTSTGDYNGTVPTYSPSYNDRVRDVSFETDEQRLKETKELLDLMKIAKAKNSEWDQEENDNV